MNPLRLATGALVWVAWPLAGLGAEAGERPRLADPSDVVRACPAFGPGFVMVPGTTTCLRIAGQVAAETGFRLPTRFERSSAPPSPERSAGPSTGFTTRGRLTFDARTDTDWGPVRTFVRLSARSGRGRDADRAYVQFGR